MANYTYTQLEQLWLNAGGSPALAPLAAGIAMVESSGNPQAYNPSGASGLWQIEIPINQGHVPGGAANVFNAQDNAAAAVSLSGNTLGGLTSNWLAFEPAGAAQAIAKQNGGTTPGTGTVQGVQGNVPGVSAPGAIPSGAVSLSAFPLPSDTLSLGAANQAVAQSLTSPASGGGGGGGGSSATGGTGGTNNSPAVTIGGFPVPGFGTVGQAAGTAANGLGILDILARFAKDFNGLVGLFNAFLADIEWLFVPSNWVRIFAFLFGIGAMLPGIWALMKTGSGQHGDITMALGILLVTFGGVMLFIAFHNLPTTVQDLGGLLNYITDGIQSGAAPDTGAPGFGPSSSAAGSADVLANATAATAASTATAAGG
jgi:hypothetical protein